MEAFLNDICVMTSSGKQLALLETSSAVRTCGFDFSGNIIMFSTDKQMGYQCFLNYFDLRDPQQIGWFSDLPISYYYHIGNGMIMILVFSCRGQQPVSVRTL